LSGQVEIETTKAAAAEPAKQVKAEIMDDDFEIKGSPVRVASMDEGSSAAKQQWGTRMMSIGGGPAKADMLVNEMGKLVLDEGKSRYVSNNFWARSVFQ
jgi:hypothetical protein